MIEIAEIKYSVVDQYCFVTLKVVINLPKVACVVLSVPRPVCVASVNPIVFHLPSQLYILIDTNKHLIEKLFIAAIHHC